MRRRGVQIRILSLLSPRELLRQPLVSEAGLDRVTCYDQGQFSKLLDEFRPQLFHAHFATEATAIAQQLAVAHGLPFTFTSHGYDIYRRPPEDYHARALAAAAVVTVSRANTRYIAETFRVPPSRIRLIPCGVDTGRFRPAPNGRNPELPLLVCVARHVPVKNLALLLRSCALLRDRQVRFRCLMVGDGPCRKEIEALRIELDLQDCIDMPGAADQTVVLDCWHRAAIGVLTSHSEGMPVSLMEAAACAVPVVATHVGGVPELVEPGKTGFLVPSGDAAAFASALERLLRDPFLRKEMGAAARHRAETQFSLQSHVDKLLGLWSEILEPTNR